MPMRIIPLLLVTTALVTLGAPCTTFATGGRQIFIAQRGGSEAGVSLNEAVQQVQRETGGRVLSADTMNQRGQTVHRIKVLTPSGQVRIVNINAQPRGR